MPLDFGRLPKIELHAHLSGSISRHCLHRIWANRSAADAAFALQDPLLAIPNGKVDYDLETFFPLFSSYIYNLCSDLPSIEYSTNSVLQDFQSDGVVYLELRTTPRAIPSQNISKDDYTRTVLNVLQSHNSNPANTLRANLILSVDRRNTLPEAEAVVDLALAHRANGVVGMDLCGDPAKGDISLFTPAFHRAKEAGLKITLHFAEAPSSSTDAELATLLSWGPDRLGHVIHVSDAFAAEIEERGVAVELCLSCNVHARMITGSYSDHHFGAWRHRRVGVALSTDDVGVFCSPLSEEYRLAVEHFKLSKDEVRGLCEGAVGAIFGGEQEMERLREIYAGWDWEGW